MKVVVTLLLSQTCNRSPAQLRLRKFMIYALRKLPNQGGSRNSPWANAAACDHVVVGLEAERRVVLENYGISPAKVSTVPLGLSENFLQTPPATRDGNYLISVGTIAPVKRSLELARLARKTGTPILFVGKPFEPDNAYWREFSALIDDRIVRHQPHVSSMLELLKLYHSARGFVLMSQYENWSFVAHEAAACGLPLLLMDLPWSRERFGAQANFFPKPCDENSSASALQTFYENAATLPAPRVKLYGWPDVANRLKAIYESLS
jgi:glycosyltransferase involved in cell wall biosynthesis